MLHHPLALAVAVIQGYFVDPGQRQQQLPVRARVLADRIEAQPQCRAVEQMRLIAFHRRKRPALVTGLYGLDRGLRLRIDPKLQRRRHRERPTISAQDQRRGLGLAGQQNRLQAKQRQHRP